MSHELHVPQEESTKSNLSNETFFSWLKHQYIGIFSQAAVLLSIAYFFFSFFYYVSHGEYYEFLEPRTIQKVIYWAHLPILALFIGWLIWIRHENNRNFGKAQLTYKRIFDKSVDAQRMKEGEKRLAEFKKWFLVFWIGMFLLYFSFIIQLNWQSSAEPVGKREIFRLIEDLERDGGETEHKKGAGEKGKSLKEKIRRIEILIENSPDVRTNAEEHKIFSEFKVLKDNSLKEKTGKILTKLENPQKTALFSNIEIKQTLRAAYEATDSETRERYLGQARDEATRINSQQANEFEKEIFEDIRSIGEKNADYKIDAETFKQRVKTLNDNIKTADIINSAPKDEVINRKILDAYKTDDALERLNLIKEANELVYKRTSYAETQREIIFTFITYLFNNLGSWLIFVCFLITARVSFDDVAKKSEQRKFAFSIAALAILILAFLITVFSLFYKGVSKSDLTSWIVCFDGLSGILNAVTLALLIARLDSKLIGLPSYLIGILYFYAAFQPLFVVFELPGEVSQIIKAVVLIVVFISKIYFFLIITFAMQSGRLLTYLYCFPTLSKRADSIFANKFLIECEKEEHHFKVSIRKYNEKLYSGEVDSDDEETFFKKITELRRSVRKLRCVRLQPLEGNHDKWGVHLFAKSNDDKPICVSVISSMTKEEAEKLQTETVDYLPYCDVRYVIKENEHLLLIGENIAKSFQKAKTGKAKPASSANENIELITETETEKTRDTE